MNETTPTDPNPVGRQRAAGRGPLLGLPVIALLGLVLLAVVRVPLHDLGLLPPDSAFAGLLALLPPLVWVAVAVVWSTRPLRSLAVAGAGYGVGLAIVHNLMWNSVFADAPPQLGGALGDLPAEAAELLMRAAATGSSIVTGVVVGTIAGLAAWGIQSLAVRAGARLPRTRAIATVSD